MAALGADGRVLHEVADGVTERLRSTIAIRFLGWHGSLSCVGGRVRRLFVSR